MFVECKNNWGFYAVFKCCEANYTKLLKKNYSLINYEPNACVQVKFRIGKANVIPSFDGLMICSIRSSLNVINRGERLIKEFRMIRF